MVIEVLNPGAPLEAKFLSAAARIFQVIKEEPEGAAVTVALCGGRSVVGLLQALLTESVNQPPEALKRVHFFMVDERIVQLTDPESNFGGLAKQFFNQLVSEGRITNEQLHPLVFGSDNAQGVCDDYLRELKVYGGAFTVVVLGVGEDGHIAGLFPRHPALFEAGARFIPFYDSPKPPAARVTASRDLVTGAKLAVLLVVGEGKRSAWEAFRSSSITLTECPAKLTESVRSCVVVSDL